MEQNLNNIAKNGMSESENMNLNNMFIKNNKNKTNKIKKKKRINKKNRIILIISIIGILISPFWFLALPFNVFAYINSKSELESADLNSNFKILKLNFVFSIIGMVLNFTFLSLEITYILISLVVR